MATPTRTPRNDLSSIWFVTREFDGLAGAGGVKDVSRQLAMALARTGRKVSVVLPLYGFIDAEAQGFEPLFPGFPVEMNYAHEERTEFVRVFHRREPVKGRCKGGRLDLYLLDAERFFEKKAVYTYTAEEEAANPFHRRGSGHFDYFAMNILLQKGALAVIIRQNDRPDVIHCHDGHSGCLPAMIREVEGYRHYFCRTGAVLTIHNAGVGYHQEVDDLPFAEAVTGLPHRVIHDNLLDGRFDPLLAASPYALLNTVSENYARELRETDADRLTGWLGHRLLARGVFLEGITNGIDPEDFNPEHHERLGLPKPFSPRKGDFSGKSAARKELAHRIARRSLAGVEVCGTLDENQTLPLLTFVGRLTTQKGVDKLVGALETLLPLDRGFQVAILGSGAPEIEGVLAEMAEEKANHGRVCLLKGYDPRLANLVYAAGDFFLIPSQYEPCGLTDYIAQLLGNLPIVHHVGGLVKVIDNETGFAYQDHTSAALMGTIQKALALFRNQPEKILDMRRRAVQHIYTHYTWDIVVKKYLDLYRRAKKLTS